MGFDMTKNPNYYPNCDMAMDANSYTANATSIDYKIWKVGDWPGTIYYNQALEWWDDINKYWVAQELQTGYFNVTTPKKSFYLAGKQVGSYRFTCYINVGSQNSSPTYINRTAAFQVAR